MYITLNYSIRSQNLSLTDTLNLLKFIKKKIEQRVSEEREKNEILQKSIQALATENHILENQVDISHT